MRPLNYFRVLDTGKPLNSFMQSWLIIGDTHFGDGPFSPNQERAIAKLLALATNNQYRLASVGDFLEMGDVSYLGKIRAELQPFLAAFAEYQRNVRQKILIIKGNHDRYLNQELLADVMPDIRCQLIDGIFFDEKAKVVIHHGDLADITAEPLSTHLERCEGTTTDALVRFFSTDPQYVASKQKFHAANMIDLWADMRRWERTYPRIVSNSVQQEAHNTWYTKGLFHAAINHSTDRTRWQSKVATWLMHRGPLMSLAMNLAENEIEFNHWLHTRIPDAQVIVQGHSHVPASRIFEGDAITLNAGSTYSKARFPTATLWNPDKSTGYLLGFIQDEWRVIGAPTHVQQVPATYIPPSQPAGRGWHFANNQATFPTLVTL